METEPMKVVPICRECPDHKQYLANKKVHHQCYSPDVKEGRGKTIGARGMVQSPPWCPKRDSKQEEPIEEGDVSNEA